jgi:hypothetical protein
MRTRLLPMRSPLALGMRSPFEIVSSTMQKAIALLRSLGTSAHVWLPGANGVSVASLPSNNYLLSDGSTGYSTVDGVDGLTLDGMGSLGSELLAVQDLTTWSVTAGTPTINNATTVTYVGDGQITKAISTVAGRAYWLTIAGSKTGGNIIVYSNSNQNSTGIIVNGTFGTYYFVAQATGFIAIRSVAAQTVTVTSISVKEYTGTHLTQPTTANKPLVRRGAYNLLKYSEQFGNAAWAKTLSGSGVLPVVTDNYLGEVGVTRIQVDRGAGGVIGDQSILDQSVVSTVGAVYYGNCQVKATAAGDVGKIIVSRGAGGAGYRATTLTAEWKNFGGAETAIATAASLSIGLRGTISSCSQTADFLIRSTQHTSGAAAEDYTTTTATAASNPSAGKYWWSFDGSNDSLLSGNLGITNACTIVIAGRVNSLGSIQFVVSEADTQGALVYIATDGSVYFQKSSFSTLVNSAAGTIVAGVPFVLTARLSGGTAVIRLNGAQVATAATAQVLSATTGMRVGGSFSSGALPFGGALGWVVLLPVALSDADCLTVERLVGSQFPGMSTVDGDANSMLLEDGSGFLTMETGDLLLLE